jgi:hypothetical protein
MQFYKKNAIRSYSYWSEDKASCLTFERLKKAERRADDRHGALHLRMAKRKAS